MYCALYGLTRFTLVRIQESSVGRRYALNQSSKAQIWDRQMGHKTPIKTDRISVIYGDHQLTLTCTE
jgi:hypothetical protein